MFIKPISSIVFQKQQISTFGCCLPRDQTINSLYLKMPIKSRVYSQSRQSKSKKLDLTITKKNNLHTKQTHHSANTSLQRRKRILTSRSKQRQTSHQKSTNIKYLKTTNQYIDSKDPKTYINNYIRDPISLQSTHRNQSIKNVQFQKGQKYDNKKYQQGLHIPDISLISKVDQQFISQGSATLTILNSINNTQRLDRPQLNNQQYHTMRRNIINPGQNGYLPSQKIISSPLQRMDRKRYQQKIEKTKKKMIN